MNGLCLSKTKQKHDHFITVIHLKEKCTSDQLFKYVNIFYILCFLSYLYDSIDYPNGEYFTDLIKYPFSILGPGTIQLFLAFVPVFFVGLISITLTYILWRKGDSSAKYLLMTFCIPVIIPIIHVFFDLYTIEVINSNILVARNL